MKKTIKKAKIRELCSSEKTVLIDMLQEQNNLQKEQINRLQARLKNQKIKNPKIVGTALRCSVDLSSAYVFYSKFPKCVSTVLLDIPSISPVWLADLP